jgi:hypothetical protein
VEPWAAIGRLGFRRWYERQLMQGHAWLVGSLMCLFALLALFENPGFGALRASNLIALVEASAAGCIGWYALSRYLRIMMVTQRLAEQSTCKRCGTYGRYRLVGASVRSMSVRCQQCANEWSIA